MNRLACGLFIVTALAGYIVSKNLDGPSSDYEVIQITELVRHGARSTYNSLLHTSLTSLLGQSELTPNGMLQHFILGKKLRRLYPQIFNDQTSNKEVNIKVSPVPRCIQSSMSELFGLFPNGNNEKPNDPENFSPVFSSIKSKVSQDYSNQYHHGPFTLQISNPEVDTLFSAHMPKVCPAAVKGRVDLYSALAAKYLPISNEISRDLRAAGFDSNSIVNATEFSLEQLTYVYDEAEGFRNYYGKLIDGISPELFTKLNIAANLYYTLWYGEENFERLITYKMAEEMLKQMEDRVNGGVVKFNMYTGHNTNIHAFSILLGLSSVSCMEEAWQIKELPENCAPSPGYASSYIFELNKKNGHFYVRTLLDGKPVKICQRQLAGEYCDWETFKKTFSSKLFYQGGDFSKYCGNPKIGNEGQALEQQSAGLQYLFYLVVLLMASCALTFSINLVKSYRKNKLRYRFMPLEDFISV